MRKTIATVLLLVVALPVLAQERERNLGAIYDGLGPMSCGERKEAYRSYDREQQLELWTLHLQRFLAAHPQLTPTQRSFVYEALGMIASGALDRVGDPAATSLVQAFQERALRQFDRETGLDAFVRLGGKRDPAAGARRPSRVRVNEPLCDCEGDEDCGGFECNFFRPCQEGFWGCGWLGQQLCVGTCW